jgi:formamidopyrimidine-DNA glycosylase
MPELPDVAVYVERLAAHLVGHPLRSVRLASPFLLRTVEPPLAAFTDREVTATSRIGKRLVLELADEHFLVIHLMVAGRLRWRSAGAKITGRSGLAGFDFDHGTLVLTEASKKKRASLHAVAGRGGLRPFDRGGLDVLTSTPAQFAARLRQENHTIKRSLTDPRILDGIGNAYSDEILHHARLSPVKLTSRLTDDDYAALHASCVEVLTTWTERLRAEVGDGFPDKVTAFRPEMAVHGRYREPCPDCGKPVQRIVHADNETNYCAQCQNQGKLLADRALSRLLKRDWPRTLDELEELRHGGTS